LDRSHRANLFNDSLHEWAQTLDTSDGDRRRLPQTDTGHDSAILRDFAQVVEGMLEA
jgi:hypothetical protein